MILEEIIRKQKLEIERLEKKNKKQQDRINKAIEYIDKCREYHRTYHHEEKIFPDEIVSLKMVLKGDGINE